MKATNLINLTMAEASELIHKKEISPVELTDAYLERIKVSEESEHRANWIDVFYEEAHAVAKALEEMQMANHFLGPLHGIPMGFKDNIAIAGKVSSAGSKVLNDFVPETDAPVLQRMKSAGAVILGHTNMHELAWGGTTDNPHYGPSLNPWDLTRFCGGSSGGSAAAVANATALAALGTDTGGSVRIPSSACGTVGMRPTIGRVPIAGITPLALTFDTCGPMTRNVRDNAMLLNVMAGWDSHDPSSSMEPVPDYTAEIGLPLKGMRIGVIPNCMFEADQPDVEKRVREALKIFESLGCTIKEFSFDFCDTGTWATIWNIITSSEASAWHQKFLRERPEDYGDDVRILLEAGEFHIATNYVNAQKYRRYLMDQFDRAFREVDFFVSPTLPFTALPLGNYKMVINGEPKDFVDLVNNYVCIAPLTGQPCISIPCGLDELGLPVGMQLLGRPFGEATLYRAAAAFEDVYHIFDKLPGLL